MKVAHIASTSMNTQLEVHVITEDYPLDNQVVPFLDYENITRDTPDPIIISFDIPDHPLVFGEFAVYVGGSDRPILKELKEAYIFTDTGKRFCHNHYWYEVWKLRPEHLTLIEKESNDGTPQGQH
jgi:hypothetical protein